MPMNNPIINAGIPSYWGWTAYTPVIPKLYWDVYSQEERIKRLCKEYDKLTHYSSMLADSINENSSDIEDLNNDFNDFKDGELLDWYQAQLSAWIQDNMPSIIDESIKMVFFGLTEEGYFTAFIPDSWNEIQFDTGYNYSDQNTYGRLILNMYVTDTFQINGKPTNLIWEV